MRNIVAAAVLAALLPGAASAHPEGCFRRVYSLEHMQAQPQQTVTTLEVNFTYFEGGGEVVALVRAAFRGEAGTYDNVLGCWGREDGDPEGAIRCSVDCDGGTFMAWRSEGDSILLRTGGFIVAGGCGEDVDDFRAVADEGAESTTFRLHRVDAESCLKEGELY